jgi:hypothetical protein
MTKENGASVWDRLETLDERELAMLSTAAVSVIASSAGGNQPEIEELPRLVVSRELAKELAAEGLAVSESETERIVTEPGLSRDVAMLILRELGRQSELAAEIEEAYVSRTDLMILDAGLVLSGALLLFVIKLKHIKIGNNEIEFYEMKPGILRELRSMLGL